MVKEILQSLLNKKFINKKQFTYLQGNPIPRPRLFYLLPKIHKEPSAWSVPFEIPPGRPIVSDCDSETYHTAQFIDYYINPLSNRHTGYLKDTYHFVNTVRQLQIPPKSILFTMDIDSLYTNIDIDEGIQAIKNIFIKYPDKNRPDKEILQLLEINLRRNDFEFDSKFYLQIKGTAMGKKFAPAYANIFMAEWETSALASCKQKPTYYYRYLDDIWGVWPHSMEDFNQFLLTLNSHNPSIKLKSTTSDTSVDFLDTTTYKGINFQENNKLDIKVFFKETDTHALLHRTSYHPKHTYKGLLKSQLLRFHRICTHKRDFMTATKTLFKALAARGYARSFRREALKTFLETRPRDTQELLPFVTTYSRPATQLIRKIKDNFYNKINLTSLKEHKIIAAFRKNKNLQDYLVKAKIKPLITSKPRGQGQFFKHLPWIRSYSNKTVFKTMAKGNPHSKNCVYLIYCDTCGLQYVGETKNTMLQRFTQHRYNIGRQRETHKPLVSHFVAHGWSSVRATVIQCDPGWSTAQRIRAERDWIRKLDTVHPKGLNLK
uniref:GIY-YIG domain-containing protein n=1 Tax=Larimichthys crocea TaxID=215358 RepID=A0A0F8AB68_LARCR